MAEYASKLAREVALVLLRLTPVGAFVSDTLAEDAREAIRSALPKRDRKRIESIAEEAAEYVRGMASGGERNDGSAKSAAWDVLGTIERSRITGKKLVELDLDPERLATWMMTEHGQQDAEYAGQERQRNYRLGVQAFSRRLVACAMDIPGIQVLVLGEILSRQRRILDGEVGEEGA